MMSMAIHAWLLATVAVAGGQQVEAAGVRIDVSLQGFIYEWTVTNVDAPPIMRFEVAHHHTYDPHAPEGWTIEHDDARLVAWTERESLAIRPGQSGLFTLRVGSRGAVLGLVPATVGFGEAGPSHRFEAVWGPVPFPRGALLLIGGSIMGLALLHAGGQTWRARRRRAAASAQRSASSGG